MTLPSYINQYFWGDDLNQLDWDHYQKYIIQTILEKGDQKAIHWLFKQIDPKKLKSQLSEYKLSPPI